jgi:hypothetical protein
MDDGELNMSGRMDMLIEEVNEAKGKRTIDVLCWRRSGESETGTPEQPPCRD